jgi:hypothetical protein
MQYTEYNKKSWVYHAVLSKRWVCNNYGPLNDDCLLDEPPAPLYSWQHPRICRSCEAELDRRAEPTVPPKPTQHEIDKAKLAKWLGLPP